MAGIKKAEAVQLADVEGTPTVPDWQRVEVGELNGRSRLLFGNKEGKIVQRRSKSKSTTGEGSTRLVLLKTLMLPTIWADPILLQSGTQHRLSRAREA